MGEQGTRRHPHHRQVVEQPYGLQRLTAAHLGTPLQFDDRVSALEVE
jgi:hypothetical protein